ncbi:NADH-ubiquinone oxidoreductase chain L [Thioalkalivibrio nitratireducens DSM 14787]|uniref:NADH-ubiquinone oxidoreductase chain L n=1 Tax=Thioalkalivibrio nitratireducens (strain DSM 14787 / UNIQEM 213 / ALEN2) TaxID=1255043 RepID=L0E0I0_THIND|nr:NADH-quinone oxidoreductase subunit L [Thioalkalivibrio nitratireducens]AGA34752.1 NADH-ubiquinone oxidoreductase chain L [Thioalkalivibrio nitratireducens DSM 14787]
MDTVYLIIVLAPLLGAILAGLFGRQIGRVGAHSVTILGVAVSFVLSAVVFYAHVFGGTPVYNETVYTWMVSDGLHFEIGFLVDNLTAMMMLVVTFVSLMVHIYTIGYMADDPGYQRFFAYISLFTFSMLMLVMANNFLQLFFGWEAVGLVSYLLIGFWYKRPTAIYANLKAFIVNRVGDFGFLIGIAALVFYAGSLNYTEVFAEAEGMRDATITLWPGMTFGLLDVALIFLFIGAMGKSAQVPLHVWLPDSMEGPTPISALIHAATMVTAGIFMVARMSPLYEFSVAALSFILVIGAITAFFMGLIGLVQNDIKRVVAYSTLSQLGYMTVALGASAYAAGLFHLMTHAFFKALLFLAAGSVIIAMHHLQDMRAMGGLRRHMPITYVTALIGSLALIGFPFFSGFFSKDAIIEAVGYSEIPGATFAYWMVLFGVFVTALYTFRMFFLVFHGEERYDQAHKYMPDHGDDHADDHHHDHGPLKPKESPWVVTVPLILLAIPSVVAGYFIGPMLFGDFFAGSLFVLEEHDVLGMKGESYTGVLAFVLHGLMLPAFWLAIAGLVTAWYLYMKRPDLPGVIADRMRLAVRILEEKYYADRFNDRVFAGGTRRLGHWLWRYGDALVIDGVLVNGTARSVGWIAARVRAVQTGFLYHYAFVMIIGLLVLIFAFVI